MVHVDAGEVGAGAFLAQKNGDDLNTIAYFSQRFNKAQRHYSPTMKGCYGVVSSLQHWRPYLWGRHFEVVSDHAALRYLYTCLLYTSPSPRDLSTSRMPSSA